MTRKGVFNVGETLAGHRTLRTLAGSPRHVIPGHDPLVMTRYPVVSKEADGIAIRVDGDPLNWN